MSLLAQKSLLAKLMATENLTIYQAQVPTASFNVQTRTLTVPILDQKLSKELYDLFMGHEVGHALYTPFEGMKKAKEEKVNMSVLNVVEDSRIERKIKNKYPGIKAPFIKAYKELLDRDFFGTSNKDVTKMNFIDRVNLHCKIGASLALPFNEEERKLLDEVESTETYEEVVELTKRICEFMEDQYENMQFEEIDVILDDDGELEIDDEDLDVFGSSQSDDVDGEIESEQKSEQETKAEGESEDTDGTEADGTTAGAGMGAGRNLKPNPKPLEIRSETDDAYRKNEGKLFDQSKYTKHIYGNIPFYDTSKIVDYKEVYSRYKNEGLELPLAKFNQYRRESSKVVSYLVKEFELRKNADQYSRAKVSKTGELNMNKLYAYNFTDDIFKKMTTLPQGKSHGLVMFIDWSGSMVNHIENTVKQLLNLALFCKKVNIPFDVYCFIESTESQYMSRPVRKGGDLVLSQFGIINLLSSRMKAHEFTTAGAALLQMSGGATPQVYGNSRYHRTYTPPWLGFSGTPLNECIIAAMEIVPQFQKNNRLQIVNTVFLTDGEGSTLNNVFDSDYNDSSIESHGYTHMHICDPITKNEEVFSRIGQSWRMSNAMRQTDCFLRLLKQRTNSHVIGFFVGETKDIAQRAGYFWPECDGFEYNQKERYIQQFKDKFKKESCLVINSTGFDDYYVLRSTGLSIDDEEELVFKENATTRGMVSAFTKHTGKKITSRVVLNRFIDLIS